MDIVYRKFGTVLCSDVANFVQTAISRTEYSGGAVEDARQVATQTAEAFGRLVNIMTEKGFLTAEEISVVAGEYGEEFELVGDKDAT